MDTRAYMRANDVTRVHICGAMERRTGGMTGARRHAGEFPPIFERERPIAACPAALEFHRNEKSIRGANAITGLFRCKNARGFRVCRFAFALL